MTDLSNNSTAPSTGRGLPQHEEGPAVEQSPPGATVQSKSDAPSPGTPHRTDRYPSYSAVVTVLFPNRESALRAREQFTRMNHPPAPATLQWFEKELVENLWGDPLPGLAVGEHALIAHVADIGLGEQMVQLCEAAGATRSTLFPLQRIFQ